MTVFQVIKGRKRESRVRRMRRCLRSSWEIRPSRGRSRFLSRCSQLATFIP